MRRFAVLGLLCFLAAPGVAAAQDDPPDDAQQAAPQYTPPYGAPDAAAPRHDRGAKLEAAFNAANTTHDGRLTLAQAQAAGLRPIVDHFPEIDAKQHGYVTLSDVKAWHMEQMAKKMEEKAAQLRAQD